jgi:hypothetical protein
MQLNGGFHLQIYKEFYLNPQIFASPPESRKTSSGQSVVGSRQFVLAIRYILQFAELSNFASPPTAYGPLPTFLRILLRFQVL